MQQAHHVTWLDLLLKGLGLVQCSREAINEESSAARLQHGLLQQSYGDLQGGAMPGTSAASFVSLLCLLRTHVKGAANLAHPCT